MNEARDLKMQPGGMPPMAQAITADFTFHGQC